jgi:hypothetical protein
VVSLFAPIRIGAFAAMIAADILSGGVEDVSSSNGTGMHLIVHHLELGKTDDLVWCLDQTTSEEINSFCAVLSVADIGTCKGD